MKRLLAIFMVLVFTVTIFAGCGKNKKGNSKEVLFERENLIYGTEYYIDLANIDSFEFAEKGSAYETSLNSIINNDLSKYTKEITSGKVQDGDITNIDYAGSVNGVAFTGGTAKDQSLTIGSGKFIEGFEEQLIGVRIGQTVTITVTFPDNYGDSTDLATGSQNITLSGAQAQFVVTINGINRPFDSVNDEFAVLAGFENADAYYEEAKKSALSSAIYDYIENNSKFKDYPSEDDGTCFTYYKNYYTSYAAQNGATFEQFLQYNSLTEDDFRKEVLKELIILYACFDKLGLTLENGAVDAKINELATELDATADEIVNNYTRAFIELQLVSNMAMDKLIERAKIVSE